MNDNSNSILNFFPKSSLDSITLEISISKVLKDAWALLNSNLSLFLSYTVFIGIVCGGLWFSGMIGQFLIGLITPLLTAGYFCVSFKILRNEPCEFSDFFKAFSYWYPLTLSGFIGGLLMMLGFAALIIPGVYLHFTYLLSTQLILDEKLEAWDSLEISRKIITKIFFKFSLMAMFSYVLVMSGVIFLGVGVLITFPLYFCFHSVLYKHLINQIKSKN